MADTAVVTVTDPVIAYPVPEPSAIAAVRASLGKRRPMGADRAAPAVDRLNLLAAALDPATTALVVLWLSGERRPSAATRRAYADDLLGWAHWARVERGRERFGLADLTRADVSLWLAAERGAGRASSSIARRLATLSSLYRYAASHGLPLVCPINDDDHRPKVHHGRIDTSARVLTAGEIAAMLAAARNVRDALVVSLLFTDALRVSEVTAATVDDVTVEGRRCWLTVTRKGGARVRVPLDPAVCDLLDAYQTVRPTWTGASPAPLILDAAGAPLDRHDVRRMLRRLARAAGIPRPTTVGPHSLRASAITDLIDHGRPATEVQAMAGHADLRTTMRYIERKDADERNAAMAANLARVLAAVPADLRSVQ
jgi:integrase/recombinase XerD